MKKQTVILFFTLLLAALCAYAQKPGVELQKDIVYGTADGVDLVLNFAKPAGATVPLPCIVCIHGGGWQLGNKNELDGLLGEFTAKGYAAASVGYRFTPEHKWPAQVQDVRCAVRYLRANAEKLGIIPDKMGAMGHSAGGHLALMLGLMDATSPLDSACNPGQSSKVQAVANHFGPVDFPSWQLSKAGLFFIEQGFKKSFDQLLIDLVGTADRSAAVMKEVSPTSYIDAQDPPILTLHGDIDALVPVAQARTLHDLLQKAGTPNKFVVIEKGIHGFGGEKYTRAMNETVAFFDKYLK